MYTGWKHQFKLLLDHALLISTVALVLLGVSIAATYTAEEYQPPQITPDPGSSSGGSNSGGSSSGSGGSGGLTGFVIAPPEPALPPLQPSCSPEWSCGEPSGCTNSVQTTTCIDTNNCEPQQITYAPCTLPEPSNLITGQVIGEGGTGSLPIAITLILSMLLTSGYYLRKRLHDYGWANTYRKRITEQHLSRYRGVYYPSHYRRL